MSEQLMKRAIVEFIGAFALSFFGIGAIIWTGDVVAIALAHGLAIGLCVMALGHISGGHFNPAITTAMIVTKRIDQQTGGIYIVSQLLGALAAAIGILLTFPSELRDAANFGVPAVGSGFSAGNALIAEIIATFFLVLVVFGTAVDNRSFKGVAGLCIGLTITLDFLGLGGVSGAAMNPSRWFGAAVIGNHWSDFWIWIVGPVVGALIAAFLYNDVILSGEDKQPV